MDIIIIALLLVNMSLTLTGIFIYLIPREEIRIPKIQNLKKPRAPDPDPELERIQKILQNIDQYDGTPAGQTRI